MYILKSVGDSTPPCGTPYLNWRCVDVDVLLIFCCDVFDNVVWDVYWCSLCVSVCVLTVSKPSSLHNNNHTKHTHATRVQNTTLYSDGTTHIK